MNSKKERLNNFRLYAITDLKEEDLEIVEKIESALRGGVDVLQLRSKTLPDRAIFELGKKIRLVTRRMKKLFIVNDRVDLMLACDADGVHLGQDDLPIPEARRLCGKRRSLIGRSTHSLSQALEAEREGADYIGFGPIFGTPTKPTYPPVGLNSIREVVNRIKIPVVCIGGIDLSNVERVIQAGANRVAVVRSIFQAADPGEAARVLVGHCDPPKAEKQSASFVILRPKAASRSSGERPLGHLAPIGRIGEESLSPETLRFAQGDTSRQIVRQKARRIRPDGFADALWRTSSSLRGSSQ